LTAGVLEELPGLEGHTVAMANYVPGDAIYVVADPEDGASTFFRQLGIEVDPELVELADGAAGRAELSLEQVELLDSDLLVLLTNGADPTEIPGYDNLPAVRSGAVAVLDVPTITGLNTPSNLSVPYALDAVRPALEALDAS
jgi:iron complex transport system substrate-binding protein